MKNRGLHTNTAQMTPATIHLKIANDIAEELGINVSGQILLGALSPDAVFARVGYKKEDLDNSHYRQESIKKSWFEAAKEFNATDNLFLKGYCIHIMADVLWLSGIYSELNKKYGEEFSQNTLVQDMDFLEKWLFRQKEYLALWNGVSGAKITNINYYVSPGEIELYKTQKSQSIKYDEVSESMQYLTLDEIDKFIKKSVKRILSELKK